MLNNNQVVEGTASKVTIDSYLENAKNGRTDLFNTLGVSFSEGFNYEKVGILTYFVIFWGNHTIDDKTEVFEIHESDMFEFMKIWFSYCNSYKTEEERFKYKWEIIEQKFTDMKILDQLG